VDTVWGSINATGGGERVFGEQIEGRSTHSLVIRFRRDVTAANRVKYAYAVGGTNYERLFNINRVENVGERDRYLKLYCTEGVAT
jgi:SPP1 family predicted phage head-tail adaptor